MQIDPYATAAAAIGNVGAGSIRTLKSSIPFVAGVENRGPATGGVDGEDLESAKARGPILLRTRNRAVTAEDFEQLTRAAAPEIARVKCLPAGDGAEAGSVRILVVPAAPIIDGQIRFEHLVPSEDTMERILNALDGARLVGTRVIIEPPVYQGVTVVAQVKAPPKTSAVRVREEASAALHRYFNPLVGGPDGTRLAVGPPDPVRRGLHRAAGDPRRRLRRGDPRCSAPTRSPANAARRRPGSSSPPADRLLLRAPDPSGRAMTVEREGR